MRPFRQIPKAMFGRIGEMVAAHAFRCDGFGVICSFKISSESDDEAPTIELENRREILPDLDISKRGERAWVEVKTFKSAAWNRTMKCHVHGVARRLFDNYVAVEDQTGSDVYLAVNELDAGMLIMSNRPLSAMQKYSCLCGCGGDVTKHRESGHGVRGPQWYFDRDTFTARYRFSDSTLEFLRSEHDRLIRPSFYKQVVVQLPQQLSMFDDIPFANGSIHGRTRVVTGRGEP